MPKVVDAIEDYARRNAKSLNQALVELGLHWNMFSRWKKGQGAPRMDTLRRIADVMNVDAATLLNDVTKLEPLGVVSHMPARSVASGTGRFKTLLIHVPEDDVNDLANALGRYNATIAAAINVPRVGEDGSLTCCKRTAAGF